MAHAKHVIGIKTKITDPDAILQLSQPIVEFAIQHGFDVTIGYNPQNQLICECSASGKSSAYCKGCCAEIKEMLKDAFKCKLETIFYMS